MTVQRMIFRLWVRTLEALTRNGIGWKSRNLDLNPQPEGHVDIINVAFNNAQLIELQNKFQQRFIQDDYSQIVVDNSTNKVESRKIEQFCRELGIAYLRMPKNWLNHVGPSYSHAGALNFVWYHVIRKRKPTYFGILDHDLFPIKPVSIAEKLQEQPIYGALVEREPICWYMHASLSFFRYDAIKERGLDFMPVNPLGSYLDTGGGNWYRIYKYLDKHKVPVHERVMESLREGGDWHSDMIQYIDDRTWLHTINGSCWKAVAEGKDVLVHQILMQYLGECSSHLNQEV